VLPALLATGLLLYTSSTQPHLTPHNTPYSVLHQPATANAAATCHSLLLLRCR
jgi:hypothetical protein